MGAKGMSPYFTNTCWLRPSPFVSRAVTWKTYKTGGIPEAEGNEDVPLVLEFIFNDLLGNPASHKIKMNRAHRALCPKGASKQPRDVICCIHDFALKEKIMAKACAQRAIVYAGASLLGIGVELEQLELPIDGGFPLHCQPPRTDVQLLSELLTT